MYLNLEKWGHKKLYELLMNFNEFVFIWLCTIKCIKLSNYLGNDRLKL